jgi:hypothetical protein
MTSAHRLRVRFLSVLSGGALLGPFLACGGGSTDETNESVAPTSSMCSGGRGEVVCSAPGETHFNTGNVPPDAQVSTPTPEFDQNRCQVRKQVSDGCCNAAVTGPAFVKGQCCYGFCTGACCGRPLVVGGVPRLAPALERDDWLDEELLARVAASVPLSERTALARAWLEDARMEHASIASFARFVLDLLAFGAPSELVDEAQRAMADEIRHARCCFSVATAYSGVAWGPGPLPLEGVAPSCSLAEAAAAAAREGCVGETVAALALGRQSETAQIPVLRTLLRQIAADEANHAELAWKFLQWALRTGGTEVQTAIERALDGERPSSSASRELADGAAWRAQGRLAPGDLDAVATEAWRDVIAPCARLLQAISLHVA